MSKTWEEKKEEIVLQGKNATSLLSAYGNVVTFNSTSSDGTMHSIHFDKVDSGIILTVRKSEIVQLLIVDHGDEVDCIDSTMVEHKVIINLSDEGDRWEGDAYKGKPCGIGTLWDSDNNIAFEGICVNGLYECFGTSYYSDVEKVEYKGEWCGGKRNGQGCLYDRNGCVVFEGKWCDDSHDEATVDAIFTKLEPFNSLCSTVETIRINNNTVSSFASFSFHYLPSLVSVFFEGKALCDKAINGSFSVYNCPNLKSFIMKPRSCHFLTSFSIYSSFHVSPFH